MAKRPPARDSRADELIARGSAVLESGSEMAPMRGRSPAAQLATGDRSDLHEVSRISDRSDISPVDTITADEVAYLRTRWGISDDATPAELMRSAVEDTQTAMHRILRAGAAFLLLKQAMPRGQFLPAVAATGLAPQRAHEAMQLERARLRMPEAEREKFLAIPKTKALMIASLDAETANSILGGDQYEDWMGLSKRALADRIKRLEREKADLQTDKETADAKLLAATKDISTGKLTKLDLWRRRRKLSAHGLAELGQRIAQDAVRLVEEISEPQWQPRDEDDALADKALCTAVRLELEAAKAAWDDAYTRCLTRFKGRMSMHKDDVPVMTPAEIHDARRLRAAMAEMTQKELDHLTALNYARDALDDATERGATPKAFRKLRKAP